MKTKSLIKLFATFGTLAMATVSFGQASFLFDIDDTNGSTNLSGVGASGTVSFDVDAGNWSSTVDIMNDSTVTAMITGFYILKPAEVDATSLDSGLAGWSLDNDDFGSLLNEYFTPGKDYTYLYFGADTQNPGTNGLAEGNSAIFEFSMGDLSGVDFDEYLAIGDVQHIFVRWQGVNGGNSAKGYDDFEVPEPSHIAAMAMLGLGGMLFLRRRLTKKK